MGGGKGKPSSPQLPNRKGLELSRDPGDGSKVYYEEVEMERPFFKMAFLIKLKRADKKIKLVKTGLT